MSPLIDALPVALLHVGNDGKILYANARAHRVLGRDRETTLGAAVEHVLAPLSTLTAQDRDGERPRVTLNGPDGDRAYGFHAGQLDDQSWLIVFQDITKVEQTQQERNRLLQMASISEVMPAVLHELKNPLAGITAALEVLVEDLEVEHSSYTERVHAMLSEVRRLALTIDGLGRFRHEVRSSRAIAIDLALREAFTLLAPQAAAKGVDAELAVEDMPLLPFEAAAVRAVVFNLFTNAVHACGRGARIRLHARYDRAREAMVLEVSDTGAGMTAEVRKRCTELFFTTKAKGSGIGLALCAGVAEAVGGSLSIESAPGTGTRVTLVFPLHPMSDTTFRRPNGTH